METSCINLIWDVYVIEPISSGEFDLMDGPIDVMRYSGQEVGMNEWWIRRGVCPFTILI